MKSNTSNPNRTAAETALKHFQQKANGVKPWKKNQKKKEIVLNKLSDGVNKTITGVDETSAGKNGLFTGENKTPAGEDKVFTAEDKLSAGEDKVFTGENKTSAPGDKTSGRTEI